MWSVHRSLFFLNEATVRSSGNDKNIIRKLVIKNCGPGLLEMWSFSESTKSRRFAVPSEITDLSRLREGAVGEGGMGSSPQPPDIVSSRNVFISLGVSVFRAGPTTVKTGS